MFANKNAAIDGRWDSARKLGNRNQYNPFSQSWKNYELAFGNQETISEELDIAIGKDPELIKRSVGEIMVQLGIPCKGLIPYIEEWKKAKAYLDIIWS